MRTTGPCSGEQAAIKAGDERQYFNDPTCADCGQECVIVRVGPDDVKRCERCDHLAFYATPVEIAQAAYDKACRDRDAAFDAFVASSNELVASINSLLASFQKQL